MNRVLWNQSNPGERGSLFYPARDGESVVDWPACQGGAGTRYKASVPTGGQVARKQTGAKQSIKVTGAYTR